MATQLCGQPERGTTKPTNGAVTPTTEPIERSNLLAQRW
jgi:hypothetical protein